MNGMKSTPDFRIRMLWCYDLGQHLVYLQYIFLKEVVVLYLICITMSYVKIFEGLNKINSFGLNFFKIL